MTAAAFHLRQRVFHVDDPVTHGRVLEALSNGLVTVQWPGRGPETHPGDELRAVGACVFCDIIAGRARADIVWKSSDALAFVPLKPVTAGHILVVPRVHVENFTTDPFVSGAAMVAAADLAGRTDQPMNLITSRGVLATQTVFHLHLHLVPRRPDDGLPLPWTERDQP